MVVVFNTWEETGLYGYPMSKHEGHTPLKVICNGDWFYVLGLQKTITDYAKYKRLTKKGVQACSNEAEVPLFVHESIMNLIRYVMHVQPQPQYVRSDTLPTFFLKKIYIYICIIFNKT